MREDLGTNGLKTVLPGDKISVGELQEAISDLNMKLHETRDPQKKAEIRAKAQQLATENPRAVAWWRAGAK